jgi:hypothetical protein
VPYFLGVISLTEIFELRLRIKVQYGLTSSHVFSLFFLSCGYCEEYSGMRMLALLDIYRVVANVYITVLMYFEGRTLNSSGNWFYEQLSFCDTYKTE